MTDTTEESEFADLRCPLCGKPLTGDEYQHVKKQLEKKLEETYEERSKQSRLQQEEAIKQMEDKNQKEIVALKKNYAEQFTKFEGLYKSQLEEMTKQFEKLAKERKEQYDLLEQKMKEEHQKDLEAREKQLKEMKAEQARLEELARSKAKEESEADIRNLKGDLDQRDLQIKRLRDDIDGLTRKLSQSQSELKGEIGELDLYSTLTKAFLGDSFERQSRGTSEGDIVQHIRTSAGIIDTPIVYDNKQAQQVSKKDIEKALGYRRTHGTNYVIVVSRNLPKREIENGLIGEKDGVLIVHPSIILEVSKQLRTAIVEISKQSESKKDRDEKEAKLYDYIKSQEFSASIERLHRIYEKTLELQDAEEKNHQRLWKDRRLLISQIDNAYREISAGIESIIQNKPIFEEPRLEEFAKNEVDQLVASKRGKRSG